MGHIDIEFGESVSPNTMYSICPIILTWLYYHASKVCTGSLLAVVFTARLFSHGQSADQPSAL